MPKTAEEWDKVAEDFQSKWNFPHCIGAIDGKHIRIQPPANSGSLFFNYKGTFSVVLMALVDANYRFLYCDVGCNGRVSDGGIFAKCSFNNRLLKNQMNLPKSKALPNSGPTPLISYHVVADEAFPLRDDIMKPFAQRNLTYEKRIFNYRLSRARRVVENAFGILSNRFRVFLTTIALAPEKVQTMVLAACALHNCLITRCDTTYMYAGLLDTENPETHQVIDGAWRPHEQLQSVNLSKSKNPCISAKLKREHLTNYFLSDVGAVGWQSQMV